MRPPVPAGPVLFVRYAYPPNALGYCGPPDSGVLQAYGRTGRTDQELVRVARSFTGAWPYLELIADRSGVGDPLDRRVVEAYWVGNRLLDAAGLARAAGSAGGPTRPGLDLLIGGLAATILDRGVAHHSFHVLCAYPWAGLLHDRRMADQALRVLDQCRIRWGRVTAVRGDEYGVRSRPLTWDGRRLDLGRPETQTVTAPFTGAAVGDWVSLHWHWVCDRLSERQVRALRTYTRRHLDLVNRAGGRRGAEPVDG
jgi:hypothetical protein